MAEQLKCTCGWPQGHAPTCPHGPNQGRIRQQAARIIELEAQLAEARKDTARVDWIDCSMDCDLAGSGLRVSQVEMQDDQTLRQAIDAARGK